MTTPDIDSFSADVAIGESVTDKRNKSSVDEDVAALNRKSVLFVFAACLGLLVSVVGLFTDHFYVVLAGAGVVAIGALAWIVAASALVWKMARELLNSRRTSADRRPFVEG